MPELTAVEMAEELAEFEYLHYGAAELLELSKVYIRSSWLDRAYRDPEDIRRAHKDMLGETS